MTSADQFATRLDAISEQHSRLFGTDSTADPWTPRLARLFRFDPHRNLEPNMQVISQYVTARDVFVDVGGGAGRVSLPMALRCREAIAVDPSPAMGVEFDGSRQEAGIANARRIQSDWMDARDVTGDVVFSADVIYFVREIVPFIEKLQAAARRRVMITLWSVSPPNGEATLFELLYGEPMAPVPGFRELLAVLWDLGILPDVLALPEPPWWEGDLIPTREEAMRNALESGWVREDDIPRAEAIIAQNFHRLFSAKAGGFRTRWRLPSRELLITWATK